MPERYSGVKVERNYQKEIFKLIQSMTGESNIMAVPKIFLEIVGDLETGVFLSQLVYLTDKGSREDGFIYKTVGEWKDDLFLSEYSIRKSKKMLEEMGLIETKVMKANGSPTVHYRVNKDALAETILRMHSLETLNSQEPNVESEVSITKTTTETTTYIKPSFRNCESSDDEIKPKKEKKVFDRDSNPHKLARLLAVCIQDNKPDASFPETTIQSWADEIDKLIRLDKAKVDDIAEVIQWCQKDDFWKANILSGKALRKQFLRLSIKALQK